MKWICRWNITSVNTIILYQFTVPILHLPCRTDPVGKQMDTTYSGIQHSFPHFVQPPAVATSLHRKTCPYCGKTSSSLWSLRRHVMSVHENMRFPCAQCNKTFSQLCHLHRHMKKSCSKPQTWSGVCLEHISVCMDSWNVKQLCAHVASAHITFVS